jgi:hypothetical protein
MIQIEQFLSKMPNLLHFELDTQGYMDLIDGQRWESLVSNLIVFNFRFHLLCLSSNCSEENILDSFRSLFWLEQKHWFVAYDGPYSRQIFTVPRFAPKILICPNSYWPPLCTSSDFCFDQYIHQVQLSLFNPIIHRFTKVTSLILDIEEIVTDLVSTSCVNLIEHMPCLHSLSFRNLSVLACLLHDIVFKAIRTLHVRNAYERSETQLQLDINRLCTVFPRLECFDMELTSRQDLVLLIDQLKYLSFAKFQFYQSSSSNMSLFRSSSVTRNWLIKNSRRLKRNNNFTYEIINNKIHLWMNDEMVRCFSFKKDK